MKRRLATLVAALALLFAVGAQAACPWPAWEQFKQAYISADGRVIDPGDRRKITTSEGQSYALFFSLAAGDQTTFEKVLRWTENNLAQGALQKHLPAWLWGQNKEGEWGILDENSAADADLWIVWSLLEAGRLWRKPLYLRQGERLLKLVAREEVAQVPGLGFMLLPGKYGFNHAPRWKFNPSYLPPQILQRIAHYGEPWPVVRDGYRRMLLETSPQGFVPDWVEWLAGYGQGEPGGQL